MIFDLPLPPSQNQLLRMHWAQKKRRRDELAWLIVAAGAKPEGGPMARARVKLTRMTTGKAPDPDNLTASAKLVLDALQQASVIVDDSPECIDLKVDWQRAASRAEQGVRVEIGLRP